MTTRPSTIRELVRIGNYYAKNQHWEHAAASFLQMINELTDGEYRPLDGLDPSSLQAALNNIQDQPVKTAAGGEAGSRVGLDPNTAMIGELDAALKKAHDTRDWEDTSHVMAFENPASDDWIFVYHDREQLLPFHARGADRTIPTGRSFAFAVKCGRDAVTSLPLSSYAASQLAYALAHLSQARVNQMLNLYHEQQILDDIGAHAVTKVARHYEQALALRPDYSWAFAHLGEVYRDLGNGWVGNHKSHDESYNRILNYVIALIHYDTAINLDPTSFWACAHFGAAVVNVRVFAEIQQRREPDAATAAALRDLLKAWFPDARDPYGALLDKAMHLLVKAQQLTGNFYPWAEAYYAGTLLLKCVAAQGEDQHQLGLLSIETAVQAYLLNPSLINNSFEPGETYVNGFFQIGLLYLWSGKLSLAWKWARLGMERLFLFHFLPGVDALMGFLLLTTIAVENIKKNSIHTIDGVPVPVPDPSGGTPDRLSADIWGSDVSVSGIQIPGQPYTKADDLIQFISNVFYKSCRPNTKFFLDKGVIPNTKIKMGFAVLDFILSYFEEAVSKLAPHITGENVAQTVGQMANDIYAYREKINNKLHDQEQGKLLQLPTYEHSVSNLLGCMHSRRPSLHMLGALDGVWEVEP